MVQKNSKEKINQNFHSYLKLFKCKILVMSYESAELAKLAINIFLVSSITYANIMDNVASMLNADWKDITQALRLDKRIGKFSYINSGLGLSGGNLERDLVNIKKIVKNKKIESDYFDNLLKINEHKKFPLIIFKKYNDKIKNPKKISILGVAYKNNTNSYKNSPTIEIMKYFRNYKNVHLYDSKVKTVDEFPMYKINNSLSDVMNLSTILFIMSPLEEFKLLEKNILKK